MTDLKTEIINIAKNKKTAIECFRACWDRDGKASDVDQYYAPNVNIVAPLQGNLKGIDEVKNFLKIIRQTLPDVHFWIVEEPIAEGNYVVARWDGGGTNTGIAIPVFITNGKLGANSGKKIRFTGITIWKFKDGKIIEEITEEGSWTVLKQLGLI